MSIGKFCKGYKLVALFFQHLNKLVQPLCHLSAAVVPNDKRHLEFRMLFQFVELPGVEVGDKVTVVAKYAAHKQVIELLWQVV